jgi:hypothetical protein
MAWSTVFSEALGEPRDLEPSFLEALGERSNLAQRFLEVLDEPSGLEPSFLKVLGEPSGLEPSFLVFLGEPGGLEPSLLEVLGEPPGSELSFLERWGEPEPRSGLEPSLSRLRSVSEYRKLPKAPESPKGPGGTIIYIYIYQILSSCGCGGRIGDIWGIRIQSDMSILCKPCRTRPRQFFFYEHDVLKNLEHLFVNLDAFTQYLVTSQTWISE